jgi:hypothetical protein
MAMTLDEKKSLVGRFIAHCNQYADAEVARYRAELEDAGGERALELERKISEWVSYKAFNEYALRELETDALDHWLD